MDRNVIRFRNPGPDVISGVAAGVPVYVVDLELHEDDNWWAASHYIDDASLFDRDLASDLVAHYGDRWPEAEIIDFNTAARGGLFSPGSEPLEASHTVAARDGEPEATTAGTDRQPSLPGTSRVEAGLGVETDLDAAMANLAAAAAAIGTPAAEPTLNEPGLDGGAAPIGPDLGV